MKRLLLVEDDGLISKTLALSLSYRGIEVTPSPTAQDGLNKLNEEDFDIVILDVNLPDETGYELCRRMRAAGKTIPILMLTARVDEASAVKGIECGADDYVRKPFGLDELTARLNRLLGKRTVEDDELHFHTLRISLKKRQVWVGDAALSLYKREFDILTLLVRKAGEVVPRDQILDVLDSSHELYDRTIDSHISHLRRKLKDANLEEVRITPVYGVGYRLEKK